MNETEKYPDEYTEHYLAMYAVNYDSHNDDNFSRMASSYKNVEGSEYFRNALLEFDAIIENCDWKYLALIAQENEMADFGKEQFVRMVQIAKQVLKN